jgi:dTDP-4-amino-4,6-dideoxygalactose transaminase
MTGHPSPRIPMSRPDINDDDITRVTQVLRSGQLSLGPCLEEFEQAVSSYVGTRHAVAVSSGTAALHLCMCLADVREGSDVITTPFSFVASANCITYRQGTPVFVDIDEESFNIDAAAVADAVTARTAAILPVHVFGRPANMDSLCETASRRNLIVIEDACEAIGAKLGTRNVGTFGHAAVFAFYPNKQMTTGEGGIVCTDDAAWADRLRSMRNQGRGGGGWLDHPQLGFNYRLDEMSAALGVSQLSRIETLLERRASVAAKYQERLAHIPGVAFMTPAAGTRMSWFVYVIRLHASSSRDAVAARMAAKGIPARNYFPPIHLQPFYVEQYGYKRGQFPVTERVAASTLALPFHAGMSDEDIDLVCAALRTSIDEEAKS